MTLLPPPAPRPWRWTPTPPRHASHSPFLQHRLLELARNLALERLVPQCQRFIRGCLAREMACRLRQCTLELDEALELGNDVDLLEQAITRTAERLGTLQLVFDHEPKSLRRAKALKSKLQVWVDVTKQLEQLQGEDPSQNYPKLAAVVRTATDILNVPHTERQQQLFEEARSRLSTCAATHIDPKAREALHTLERGGLEAVLAEADSAAYESEEVSEIRRLLALPEADFVKQQLRRVRAANRCAAAGEGPAARAHAVALGVGAGGGAGGPRAAHGSRDQADGDPRGGECVDVCAGALPAAAAPGRVCERQDPDHQPRGYCSRCEHRASGGGGGCRAPVTPPSPTRRCR